MNPAALNEFIRLSMMDDTPVTIPKYIDRSTYNPAFMNSASPTGLPQVKVLPSAPIQATNLPNTPSLELGATPEVPPAFTPLPDDYSPSEVVSPNTNQGFNLNQLMANLGGKLTPGVERGLLGAAQFAKALGAGSPGLVARDLNTLASQMMAGREGSRVLQNVGAPGVAPQAKKLDQLPFQTTLPGAGNPLVDTASNTGSAVSAQTPSVGQDITNNNSVQNLNEEDLSIAAMLGPIVGPEKAWDVVQRKIANRQKDIELGSQATTAQAALAKQLIEAQMMPHEIAAKQALTAMHLSTAAKTQLETDPNFLMKKAQMESMGKGLGEMYYDHSLATTEYGQLPLDTQMVKDLGLPFKTYGEGFLMFGRKGTEDLIKNWNSAQAHFKGQQAVAHSTEAAAKEANKYKDMMMSAIDKTLDSDRKTIAEIKKGTFEPSGNPSLDTISKMKGLNAITPEQKNMLDMLSRRIEGLTQEKLRVMSGGSPNIQTSGVGTYTPQAPVQGGVPLKDQGTIAQLKKAIPGATDVRIEGKTVYYTTPDGKKMQAPIK